MIVKRFIVVLLIVFSALPSFGDLAQQKQEAQRLSNFISWQKQLGWNIGSQLDSFVDGSVSNTVRPLSGQWGVWTGNGRVEQWEAARDADVNAQTTTKKISWIHNCSEIPTALFGEQAGATPLYTGITYRFGIHTGKHILKSTNFVNERHLQIIVYDLEVPISQNLQPVYVESIQIPLNKFIGDEGVKRAFALQWDEEYLKKSGGILCVGSTKLRKQFGLENWVQYTESRTAFGHGDGSGIILSHRSNNTRYGYVIQLIDDEKQRFESLYAMDFSPTPPESIAFILQSHFMREFMPAGYWGVVSTNDEKIRDFGIQALFMEEPWHQKYWKKYQNKGSADTKLFNKFNAAIRPEEGDINHINSFYKKNANNTPVTYSALDQFVSERKDPLVLAAYIQNEIELIDGVGVPETNRSPAWAKKEFRELMEDERRQIKIDVAAINQKYKNNDVITPGKIKRSPLTTFLERQGSPWEQCSLLVYMLRQAGYAAAYVESEEPLIFSRTDFSRLLRLQLEGSFLGLHSDNNAFIRIRYPWVAYYDENKKAWVHLFPWIKETKVTEGYDLYGLMPEGYKSGLAWARHYLEDDPRILKHIQDDGNNTVAILFKRFVVEVAKEKGITPETIGVRYQNIKKSFSGWHGFPKPLCFEGEISFLDTIAKRDDLFATVQFRLNSVQNPRKEFTVKTMRLADLHNRALYLSFDPMSEKPEETQHNMVLRLEGIEGFSSGASGDFSKEYLLNVQEKKLLLDSSDREIKLSITYDQKMEGSYMYPILRAQDIQEINYIIDKGSLASICINVGRVTKEMLDFHAGRYAEMDKVENSIDSLGRLAYLAGMSYFEKLSSSDKTLRELHRINNAAGFSVGLSKISPDLTKKSVNLNAAGKFIGKPVYEFPQVDMKIFAMNEFANGGIRPDLGEERSSMMRDYYVLRIADGSSNEHQIINDFYGDQWAVSTVKLLQLAHRRHVESGQSGTGFLVFTRASLEEANGNPRLAAERYFSHIKGLNLAKILQEGSVHWEEACKSLSWNNQKKIIDDDHDSYYATIYMTPGAVYSEDGDPRDIDNQPSYKGMGTLILAPGMARAMISSNQNFMNGGYGSRLPKELLSPENFKNLQIISGENGFRIEDQKNFKINLGSFLDPRKFSSLDIFSSYLDSLPKDIWSAQYEKFREIWGNSFASLGQGACDSSGNCATKDREAMPSLSALYKNLIAHSPLALETQSDHKSIFQHIADPVDIVTGSFQIQEEDLALVSPFPIMLNRNYSSANPFQSELGYGWKRNLVPYLVLSPADATAGKSSGELIQAAESDGTVVVYRRKADFENIWEVSAADNPHLVSSGDENTISHFFHASINRELKDNEEYYHLHGANGSLRSYQVRSFPIANDLERKRPYLFSWQDVAGNKINFEYGENRNYRDYGQVKKIVATNGDFIGLSYDSQGYLVKAYARDGRSVYYDYDQYGDLVKVTLPDGTATQYTYDHKVVTNEKGKPVFHSTHRITHEEKPGGRILHNIYDQNGKVMEQKVSRSPGKLVTNAKFFYLQDGDDKNKLGKRKVRDAQGGLTSYELYDSLITHIVDPLGNNIYQSWYLSKDKAGKQLYFDGVRGSIEFAPEGFAGLPHQLMRRVDKRGLQTNYSYDGKGMLVHRQVIGDDLSGDGKLQRFSTRYEYNDNGQLTSIKQSDGKELCLSYDDAKYPKLVTRQEQRINNTPILVEEFSYGENNFARGLLLQTVFYDPRSNANKREISYQYDKHGLPIKRVHKLGRHGLEKNSKDVTLNFVYDLQGNLSREIMEGGASIKYLYDNMNRLIGIIKCDATGKELIATYYHYNEHGELEWIKGPAHDKDYTLFSYDAAGNQVAHARWRFTMDNPLDLNMKMVPLVGYQNFISQAIALKRFDDLDRMTHSFDPEGHLTEFKYSAMGQVLQRIVSDRLGGKILFDEKYEYESGGLVAKIIHGDGSKTLRFYTSNGLLKEEQYSDGTKHLWVYDLNGRVIEELTPKGAHWRISYDDFNRRIARRENNTGITKTKQLDLHGKVIEEIDGNGHITHYTYDNLDRLVEKKKHASVTTYNYKYDAQGNNLVEQKLSDGSCVEEIIDAAARPRGKHWYEANTQWPSQTLNYLYHLDGRVCNIHGRDEFKLCYFADPDGRHLIDWRYFASAQNPTEDHLAGTSHYYDRSGNLVAQTISDMRRSEYAYDALGRLSEEAFYSRASILYNYDLMGRLTLMALPAKLRWTAEYPSTTEKNEQTIWDGHTIQGSSEHIDRNTHTITTKDLNGYATIRRSDIWGRIIETVITGPNGYSETTIYNYDAVGNLLRVKQHNLGGTTIVEYSYDDNDNILTERVTLDGLELSFLKQQWKMERRAELTASHGSDFSTHWHFDYNAADQLTKLKFNCGATKLSWNYIYSEAGLLKERHTPWEQVTLEYDGGGHPIKQQVGDLLVGELLWNLDGKLRAYRYKKNDQPQQAVLYQYDNQGRMICESLLDEVKSLGQIDYYYDWDSQEHLGILTKVESKNLSSYQHIIPKVEKSSYVRPELDLFSGISQNLLNPGKSRCNGDNCTLPGDKLLSDIKLFTRYDAMGRVVEREFRGLDCKQLLTWDPRGRLLEVMLQDRHGKTLSKWQARYDGLDRRIKTIFVPYLDNQPNQQKIVTQISIYDPEVEFLELGILIASGNEQPKSLWKAYGAGNRGFYGEHNGYHGGLEAVVEEGAMAHGVMNNLRGDITLVYDGRDRKHYWLPDILFSHGPISPETILERSEANKPGALAKALIDSSNWQGRRVDATGLINFGVRYYDPLIGRFLSCDPLGHRSTPDLYVYADGDPVNNIDDDGRFTSEAYEVVYEDVLGGHLGIASMGLDATPGVGTAKTLEELRSGYDPVTGEPINRWVSGPLLVASVVPGGKVIAKTIKRGAARAWAKVTGKVEGIIYKRINPMTREKYIGKTTRGKIRFKEHDRKLGVKHRYEHLDEDIPKSKLSYIEQKRINEAGGVEKLANKRNAMSEARYKEIDNIFNNVSD